MQAAKVPNYTVAEYLTVERDNEVRHEYLNGELFARAGASRAHNILASRFMIRLGSHLEDSACRIFQSDMKVWVEAASCFYYPDLMVCCEPAEDEPDDYYETQPKVLIEILSPSTAERDDSEKRRNYQTLPSLQEYVLCYQDKPSVIVYRREGSFWLRIEFGIEDTMELISLDFRMALRSLYPDLR